jgi:hypothetical protein
MGFAASNSPISFTTITATSVAGIVSSLHSIFLSTGMVASAISGGYQFTMASPDLALGAKLRVYDDGSGYCRFQFVSLDELREGFPHHLRTGASRQYQVWANCCQVFISVAGTVRVGYPTGTDVSMSSVGGGIPFVPQSLLGDCGVDNSPDLATEVWWSFGDENLFDTTNFRWATTSTDWSACYNGDLMVAGAGYATVNTLRIFPTRIAKGIGNDAETRFYQGDQLWFEPFIGWGQSLPLDSVARVRGQLYDAVLGSVYAPIDDRITNQGFDFINYMGDPPADQNNTKFSSLYLLLGEHTPADSFGYMY